MQIGIRTFLEIKKKKHFTVSVVVDLYGLIYYLSYKRFYTDLDYDLFFAEFSRTLFHISTLSA